MKIKFNLAATMIIAGFASMMVSCNKSEEAIQVSAPLFKVGQAVSTKTPLSGPIKGTLLSDSTYKVGGDVFINENDTLVIQPGAKIIFPGNAPYCFIVKGSLLSLGTEAKPIYFTVPTAVRTDVYGADPTTDPAYKGLWGGIYGETTFKNIIIKWTHLDFGGGKLATSPVSYMANGATSYVLSTSNPNGILVLEDSWLYGCIDDPFRPFGCKFNVMRNTFEKGGFTGGESMNIKSGNVGIFAYNLIVGSATNGPKASNNGGKNPQTEVQMYNNTIVCSGYRRSSAGRGGSTNFEEGSKGNYYNNLMVNCKFGPRVVGATANYNGNALVVADTANIKGGYNYNYVDSLKIANEIYPTGFAQKPNANDIPNPSSFLPTGYKPGQVYDGTAAVGKNNPLFVNFPLPQTHKRMGDVSFVGSYNFRLQATSPAIGKGYTGFTPLNVVPVNANFGATVITPPNKDIGAYPSDNTGNKH
ncbi:MAG: hypothetical protein V4585_04400 [Bacteroidota bacterium]|jgi:hypothetical protein